MSTQQAPAHSPRVAGPPQSFRSASLPSNDEEGKPDSWMGPLAVWASSHAPKIRTSGSLESPQRPVGVSMGVGGPVT